MRIDRDHHLGHYQIKHYETGRIQVNQTWYDTSIIIGTSVLEYWAPQTLEALEIKHFNRIIELEPKIALLGVGHDMKFPDSELLAPFAENNIGIEVMTTRAACRTFEVLMAEGRNAIAALIIR